MKVDFTPELEKTLNDLATRMGRAAEDLVQDVIAGYVREMADARDMLDSRYDDLKSGRVTPIDGEAFFEQLRRRELSKPSALSCGFPTSAIVVPI